MAKRKKVSKIGGQAVLEGVMMRGTTAYATAVRRPDGAIAIESNRLDSTGKWWSKIPVLRGFLNFFSMMFVGVKITMRSAEVWSEEVEEQQPSRFEKWLAKTFHVNVMDVAMVIGVLLGVVLAVGLFMIVPKVVVDAILGAITHAKGLHDFTQLFDVGSWATLITNLMEGVLRILIFVGYIALTSCAKDIRRLYRYHGAEHKTIACFEHDLPLTVENARTMSKHHDRCGTNFMVIVMVIAILLFSLVEWVLELCGWVPSQLYSKPVATLIGIAIRLALLPFVAGIAYEVLKFLAKFDNWFVKLLKAPGMALQLLTTKEPDDSMLEVAIAAFTRVQELDADPAMPTTAFQIKKSYERCRHEVISMLAQQQDAEALADWIFVDVTGKSRSELPLLRTINEQQYDRATRLAKQVAQNVPLQYATGTADFYGYPLHVDSRVLIPRPETEQLVEKVLLLIKPQDKVLDMCTGSGAIAITLALKTAATVTAADLSADALAVAKANAQALNAPIQFVQTDLFDNIHEFYDVIVCNPPYISTADMRTLPACVKQEPAMALHGGEDGMDIYRRIAARAPLKAGGILALEIGYDQADKVRDLLSADYADIQVYRDLNDLPRIIIAYKS